MCSYKSFSGNEKKINRCNMYMQIRVIRRESHSLSDVITDKGQHRHLWSKLCSLKINKSISVPGHRGGKSRSGSARCARPARSWWLRHARTRRTGGGLPRAVVEISILYRQLKPSDWSGILAI